MTGKSADWIPMSRSGFRTGRISLASFASKGVWLELLMLAADTGEMVRVKDDGRYLARQTGGTPVEIEAALVELVGLGSVTRGDGWVTIYGADRAAGALMSKREQGRERQRRYREKMAGDAGSKTEPTTGVRPVEVVPEPQPQRAPVVQAGTATVEQMVDAVREACDAQTNVEGYRQVLVVARDLADTSVAAGTGTPKLRGHLENTVVGHAADRWHPTRVSDPDYARLYSCAKRIGVWGHDFVIWALFETTDANITGNAVSYVSKVATERAKETGAYQVAS